MYPASKQLKANGGGMTQERLHVAIESGREGRKVYYRERVEDFDGGEILCLFEAIMSIVSGMTFNKELVMIHRGCFNCC